MQLKRVDKTRQFDPEYVTALRSRDFCSLRKVSANGIAHLLNLGHQYAANPSQVTIVSSALQEFRYRHL